MKVVCSMKKMHMAVADLLQSFRFMLRYIDIAICYSHFTPRHMPAYYRPGFPPRSLSSRRLDVLNLLKDIKSIHLNISKYILYWCM